VYTREQSFSRRKGKILLHNRYWPEQQMKNFLRKEQELIGKRNEKRVSLLYGFSLHLSTKEVMGKVHK
jgi:hypothetical protein